MDLSHVQSISGPAFLRAFWNALRYASGSFRLADGQRHLADLRQVSDYCIEKLYRGNVSLEQLVEHLGRLLAEEESAGQDKNLFMLSTDKSSVRVLTMHAAKGLEFPVVFVATWVPECSQRSECALLGWRRSKESCCPLFEN